MACPIFHDGYAQRPLLAVGFCYVLPFQRFWAVPTDLGHALDRCGLELRGIPDLVVHTRAVFPLILGDPLDGECARIKGVHQEIVQAFDFAPSTRLYRLDDSALQ